MEGAVTASVPTGHCEVTVWLTQWQGGTKDAFLEKGSPLVMFLQLALKLSALYSQGEPEHGMKTWHIPFPQSSTALSSEFPDLWSATVVCVFFSTADSRGACCFTLLSSGLVHRNPRYLWDYLL